MRNPLAVAARAKGPTAVWRRARLLTQRYGLTPAPLDQALDRLDRILDRFRCEASLPLTAAVLERHRAFVARYRDRSFEFPVHGYTHGDYSRLPPDHLTAHLDRARRAFAAAGLAADGFRAPYLRRSPALDARLEAAGFRYVSDQPILWDLPAAAGAAPGLADYERAVAFYDPWRAAGRPALPRRQGRLVQIPVSLPDDEMLVDRLGAGSAAWVQGAWQAILAASHQRGELFTLQLHPERIALCAPALTALLDAARRQTPPVWIARLSEVAAWWRARTEAAVHLTPGEGGRWRVTVQGPPGTTLLARNLEIIGPAEPWADGYRRLPGASGIVRADACPVIGLSPSAPPALADFLRQQGYIVRSGGEPPCTLHLDRAAFRPEDEGPLLARIEQGSEPLLRLGRWPEAARSALVISGDIDALTLGDFGLRLLGR